MLGVAIGLRCSVFSALNGVCSCGFGGTGVLGSARPSLDVATLIFLWLTRIPRCAISALSTFLTVCFADTSSVVRTWISSTEPVPLATMRAEMTPGSVDSNSSARWMGRTLPAMNDVSGSDTEVATRVDTAKLHRLGAVGALARSCFH